MHQGSFENSVITALGHAGFIVELPESNLRFAFDPYDVTDQLPVDYIFISHPHFDHCDPASIHKISTEKTKIIAPSACKEELSEFTGQVEFVEDEEKHEHNKLTYWTIPAYNINKFRTPSEVFHPKEMGGVGFIVEVEAAASSTTAKTRFYHAGDTDLTPEMETLKKIGVAFLPISGTFVMTLEEAIQAAELIQPKLVVPMHFGKILGSSSDAIRYKNLLEGKVQVMVLTTDQ